MKPMYRGLMLSIALILGTCLLPGSALAQEVVIDPADFGTVIDNPYWPLVPGTTFVYEAESDGELARIETEVTHMTKEILGVTATVILDRAWVDGVLEERTYDWYAQDLKGNIWYLGEATEELDPSGNVISTAGSWEAGVNGAEPGIIMLADPKVGISYRQEFLEGEAEDEARILKLNARVSTEFGDFEGCLKTKEYTRLSPGEVEHKYYCPGVGLVLVEELKGKTVFEKLIEIIGP